MHYAKRFGTTNKFLDPGQYCQLPCMTPAMSECRTLIQSAETVWQENKRKCNPPFCLVSSLYKKFNMCLSANDLVALAFMSPMPGMHHGSIVPILPCACPFHCLTAMLHNCPHDINVNMLNPHKLITKGCLTIFLSSASAPISQWAISALPQLSCRSALA